MLANAAIAVPGRPRLIPARMKSSDADSRKVTARSDGALSAMYPLAAGPWQVAQYLA